MLITFNTQNESEVQEVVTLLENMGMSKVGRLEEAISPREIASADAEDTREEKATPTIDEPKKDAKEPKKAPKKSTITLADLKESAKNAVGRTSREEVKTAIAEFSEKLASVDEADYGKLYLTLQKLGA